LFNLNNKINNAEKQGHTALFSEKISLKQITLAFGAQTVDHKLLPGHLIPFRHRQSLQSVARQAYHRTTRCAEKVRMIARASFPIYVVRAKPPRSIGALHLMDNLCLDKRRERPVECNAIQFREFSVDLGVGDRAA
jgi:hypothetical protein